MSRENSGDAKTGTSPSGGGMPAWPSWRGSVIFDQIGIHRVMWGYIGIRRDTWDNKGLYKDV